MTLEELNEISKLVGQETISKIYKDGASEPTKQIGKIAEDVLKTFRLFLAPFQYAAAYQDRFEKYLERVRSAVPTENQIDCSSTIAGPIFERLKYIEETSHLKELYLNLLTRAIDKDRVNEAHPAFLSVIEQLSSDEAIIIKSLASKRVHLKLKVDTVVEMGSIPDNEKIIENDFPVEVLAFEENIEMYFSHLQHLNLIKRPQYQVRKPDTKISGAPSEVWRFIVLTEFGKLFYKACVE
jgi:hypothetical protein